MGLRRDTGPLPAILQCYLTFCAVRQRYLRSGTLRLDASFVFPTTFLPLAVLIARTHAQLQTRSEKVRGYVDWIMAADKPPKGGTYLPIIRLPESPKASQGVLEGLEDLSESTELFRGNRDAYRYLLSELVDNIYEHAEASHAYVMAQYYPRKGLMEASFMDDGMTIPKSLEQGAGATYSKDSDYQAILDALDGRSAKGTGERGYGMRTSVGIVNSLGGEVLIASSRGAVVVGKQGQRSTYGLSARNELEGTLVGLRLPDSGKRINLYDHVEG